MQWMISFDSGIVSGRNKTVCLQRGSLCCQHLIVSVSGALVMFYADSSFFVSLYLKDTHSTTALEMAKSRPKLWLTPLHVAECFHAFGQQVYFGKLAAAVAERLCDQLRRDRAANIWQEAPIPELAFERSAELARHYAPKLGTRTLDSLHVACALELKAERFWTFDDRQAKLARSEGLKTH